MDPKDLRNMARAAESAREESWQESGTDGFVSQWASGMNARLYRVQAQLEEAGGWSEFTGLFEGSRLVRAKVIPTRYGSCWLLHESECELIGRRGGQFVPMGSGSRIQKDLGLHEGPIMARAKAKLQGSGTGLSGAASTYVARIPVGLIEFFRSGDTEGVKLD